MLIQKQLIAKIDKLLPQFRAVKVQWIDSGLVGEIPDVLAEAAADVEVEAAGAEEGEELGVVRVGGEVEPCVFVHADAGVGEEAPGAGVEALDVGFEEAVGDGVEGHDFAG